MGDEIRPCWDAWPGGAEATPTAPLPIQPANPLTGAERHIEFVEVRERSAGDVASAAPTDGQAALHPGPLLPVDEPGWSLWGDLDR